MPDSAENRRKANSLREAIVTELALGHDPRLTLFEEASSPESGATSAAAAAVTRTSSQGLTVAQYYADWIVTKRPPLVRKAQSRDYKKHIARYVLPILGDTLLGNLTTKDIRRLVTVLLERELSVKYVRNIVAGSFRAMVRDWCIEADDAVNPFERLPGGFWPRVQTPPPDPFTANERDRILDWFAGHRWSIHAGKAQDGPRVRVHPPFAAVVHLLAWTGMRPSEACGLQWQDVDLAQGIVRVCRSRHLGEISAPKTGRAARTVELVPQTLEWLRLIQPLRLRPADPVFTNTDGRAVEARKLAERFHSCLRALGIRVRGIYCLKDTYISLALSKGVGIAWLEAQTGVSYSTIRRHYGQYVRGVGSDQIALLVGGEDPRSRGRTKAPPWT